MNPTTINRTMGPLEWAMLVALSVLWGSSFFFVAVAVRELPPLTIVGLRIGIAALALWTLLPALGLSMPRDRKAWRLFFGIGLLNTVLPSCMTVWAQTHIGPGVAAILNATTPMFTVIIAHFLTPDEKLTFPRLLGVVVGFIGVAVMFGGAALRSLGVNVVAELAILMAAIAYAFAGVLGLRFKAMGITPISAATGLATASALLLLPVMVIAEKPWTHPVPDGATIAAILGLALVSTVVGYILYYHILATAGATNLLLVAFLAPVSAIMLGAIVLGERLEPKHFAGMGLIGLGLMVIDGRPARLAIRLLRPSGSAVRGRHRDGV
jgi:drug/metabolite transporter (DMT)-like permease